MLSVQPVLVHSHDLLIFEQSHMFLFFPQFFHLDNILMFLWSQKISQKIPSHLLSYCRIFCLLLVFCRVLLHLHEP